MLFEIPHGVRELGEDQHLAVGMGFGEQRVERVQLGVVFRTPGAMSLKQAQQGIGVCLEVGFQGLSEKVGTQPPESLMVWALVVSIYRRGAAFAVLNCPDAAPSYFGFLCLFVQFLFFLEIRGIPRLLLLVVIGEPGIEHLGVLRAYGKGKAVADGMKEHVVS